MTEAVRLELSDHVATLTLQEPAMSLPLLDAFGRHVDGLCDSSDARAVVITGSGKTFCTGADFRAMSASSGSKEAIRKLYDTFLVIEKLDVPVIAAINGHAVGGGLGLALACDIRIIAERAKIGANFARLGIHPGMLITQRLPAIIGSERAAEMLFTGDLIRGARAAEIGLCLRALPAAEVLDTALALAGNIAAAAPLAVREIKRTLRQLPALDREGVLDREAAAQSMLSRTSDAAEGISAMLSRRSPKFVGQ